MAKNSSMLEYVVNQLQQHIGQWPRIATGSGVPYNTVTKIASRATADPRISNIQKLHDYFESINGTVAETASESHVSISES